MRQTEHGYKLDDMVRANLCSDYGLWPKRFVGRGPPPGKRSDLSLRPPTERKTYPSANK